MKKVACFYCGADGELHDDHVVPRSRGGPDIPHNIVKACPKCNCAKNDRLPSEWRSDLPERVYEVERRIAKRLEGAIAARRQKGTKKKANSNPDKFVGQYFHSFEYLNGVPVIKWQGKVLDEPSPGVFLIETYSWISGTAFDRRLVKLEQMLEWRFYGDSDWLKEAWEDYDRERRSHRVCKKCGVYEDAEHPDDRQNRIRKLSPEEKKALCWHEFVDDRMVKETIVQSTS